MNKLTKKLLLTLFAHIFISFFSYSQSVMVDFDTLKWDLKRAKVVDHLDRKALIGTAFLKNVEFEEGVIEVDIATTERTRSYPGVIFHIKDPSNYERFYIRPHRSPFYDDALQYVPAYNGLDSWQLYPGLGNTASLDIQANKWNRLKIVISGESAQVFWNNEPKPVLVVPKLSYGKVTGGLGLIGPMDGSAYFSNFNYEKTSIVKQSNIINFETLPGIIKEWELSEPFSLQYADFTRFQIDKKLTEKEWKKVISDSKGIVDISKYYARKYRAGDCIMGRTIINAQNDSLMRFGFGYSDYITVYLNKQPYFFGNSAYQSRDKGFSGVVGYFDNLFLPIKKGDNELIVMVGESMGGWGFCFRIEDEVYINQSLTKGWEVKNALSMPESVVYDQTNNVCYVSNYFSEGKEFISKVSVNGEIISREWVTGLRMPTGMCINENKLYVIDRTGLNLIDISKAEIVEKIPLTGMRIPNDVEIDDERNIYISDLPANSIFRYKNNVLEKWIENLDGPNALFFDKGRILVGQNNALISVDIKSKEQKILMTFEQGSNIDGIVLLKDKGYLVSDFFGKLYLVSFNGEKQILLNTSTIGTHLADFCIIPKDNKMIIPAFNENSLKSFILKP